MSPPNHGWGRAAHLAPFALLSVAALVGGATVRRGLRSQATTGTTDDGTASDRSEALPAAARLRVERALAQLRREEP